MSQHLLGAQTSSSAPPVRQTKPPTACSGLLHVTLLLLWLLAGCTPVRQPLAQRLAAVVEQPAAPLASLAVAVVAGDAIIYEGYWGHRRIPADPSASLPVTAATTFRVASISKLVTALGAMQLVEAGKLQLDRDISDYLGFRLRNPAYPDRPITARMLLSHTSSLRDGGVYVVPLPGVLQDLFDPAGAFYAGGAHYGQSPPGAYFTYANLNFGVLATAMEAAAGERFDHYMQRAVLAPLGINGGYLLTDLTASGLAEVATLYTKQDANGIWDAAGPWVAQFDDFRGGRPAAPPAGPRLGPQPSPAAPSPAALLAAYGPGTNATIFAPHAGLRSSARDLAKIVLLFLHEGRYAGRQIVSPATVRRMLAEQWRYDQQRNNGVINGGLLRAWGLGVQHTTGSQDAAGDRLAAGSAATFWGHRGEAYGFLGGLWFDPQRKVGFVFLIGGLGDNPLSHLGEYSSFNGWEEAIQTALLDEIAWWEATH